MNLSPKLSKTWIKTSINIKIGIIYAIIKKIHQYQVKISRETFLSFTISLLITKFWSLLWCNRIHVMILGNLRQFGGWEVLWVCVCVCYMDSKWEKNMMITGDEWAVVEREKMVYEWVIRKICAMHVSYQVVLNDYFAPLCIIY